MERSPRVFPDDLNALESSGVLRGRWVLVAAAAILAAGLAFVFFQVFQSSTVYYLTVGELLDRSADEGGRHVRVNGKLLPGSFQRDEGTVVAAFTLTDTVDGRSLSAAFTGVVPELFFNEHSDIVAEGTYGPDGVFHADNIIVKCPSKYASQVQRDLEESGEGQVS